MSDQEKASVLLDKARRRLAGCEIALCEQVRDDGEPQRNTEEWHAFQQLCTEHSEFFA